MSADSSASPRPVVPTNKDDGAPVLEVIEEEEKGLGVSSYSWRVK